MELDVTEWIKLCKLLKSTPNTTKNGVWERQTNAFKMKYLRKISGVTRRVRIKKYVIGRRRGVKTEMTCRVHRHFLRRLDHMGKKWIQLDKQKGWWIQLWIFEHRRGRRVSAEQMISKVLWVKGLSVGKARVR